MTTIPLPRPRDDAGTVMRLAEQPFESTVFGRAVMRLEVPADAAPGELADMLSGQTDEWAAAGIWLVSCRLPEPCAAAGAQLVAQGFREVETLVTLERAIGDDLPDPGDAGPAVDGEAGPCVDIARHAFRADRFHADDRVPADGADELKARWVANSFAGRADAIVVAREGTAPVGFCACMHPGPHAVIDLIATAPEAQGRGHGRALVAAALHAYAGRAPSMRVGTQAANVASLSLYRKMGFTEIARARTFHWIAGDGA